MNISNIIELLAASQTRLPTLAFMIQARRQALSHQFEERKELESSMQSLMTVCETPVHPLLLCTALAQSVVGALDFGAVIEQYCGGEIVSHLEERFLLLGKSHEDSTLSQLLELESSMLNSLMILSIERIISHRNGSTEFLQRLLKDLVAGTTPPSLPISLHNVRWATWMETNPTFTVLPFKPDIPNAILFRYGFQHNSSFHNATDYSEDHLNSVKTAINAAIANKSGANLLAELKAKYQLAVRLRDRAREFYWWNPCEIDAHATTERFMEELKKKSLSDDTPPTQT